MIAPRHGRRVRQTRSRVKYAKTGTSQLCASGRRLIPGAEARVITPARKQCGSGRNVAPARESRISVALQAEAALRIVDSVDDLLVRWTINRLLTTIVMRHHRIRRSTFHFLELTGWLLKTTRASIPRCSFHYGAIKWAAYADLCDNNSVTRR